MRIFITLVSCLLLASCGSNNGIGKPAGTGEYVNSVYVSKATKDIQSAVFGAPNSKVQLTIFSDYQCPACIVFHKKIEEKLWKDYIDTKKVTVTFKNFPLTMVHANAEGDALASMCALADGKYHEFRNEMYALEDVKKGSSITDKERVDVAKKAGITNPDFEKCLTEAWYQKKIASEMKDGEKLWLQGTPSIYLGDTILDFKSEEEFFAIIEAALK